MADEHDVDIRRKYLTTELSLPSDALDARDLVATGQDAFDDSLLVMRRTV